LINVSNYEIASNIELARFFSYFLFFIVIISFISDYSLLKDSLTYAAFLYSFFILISLIIIILFGSDFHNILIQKASVLEDSILTAYTITSDDVLYSRFSLPGINSNTVTIMSSLFAGFFLNKILKKETYKYLNFLCFYILIISIFLTLSRQGFVYIFILFSFYGISNIRKIFNIFLPFFLGLFVIDYNILYLRFLSTLDAIFGTKYSLHLVDNTSERENLINDSLANISQNFWGSSIEQISIYFSSATGEHLLYLYLISLYGYIVGVSVFILTFYAIYKFYISFRNNIFYTYDTLTFFYFSIICFVSAFFAPSYYIHFAFLGLCFAYLNCKDAIINDINFSYKMYNNKIS
tara:strand:- start:790 stop:1842 length:1053 start_codon:yes stop_codon:yes gene_type:complete